MVMLKYISRRDMENGIDLDDRLVCDLEMIMIGAFAPLTGFMTKKDYKSVVSNMKLADGSLWSIPIVLPINTETKDRIIHMDKVVLRSNYNLPLAWLTVEEIWRPNLEKESKKVLGTNDPRHPYNRVIYSWGDDIWYVGGKIEQINPVPHYDFMSDRYTAHEIRTMIAEKGWKTVVGFQTRNPMHRCHVELSKYALKNTGDPDAKLLLTPIVGVTQDDDVSYHTRVRCYKILIDKYYEKGTVKLCLLPLSMRMAGPREAILHALIRQNLGCSHFPVGRDHAGPSVKNKNGESFYGPYDAHELLDKYSDMLKIKIIKSKEIAYVKELDKYLPADEVPEGMQTLNISGTQQRGLLKKGKPIPEWFSYPEVFEELRKFSVPLYERGLCIYLVGLSGSGKTTIAKTLENKLLEVGSRPITVLDGDIVRKHLSQGLGFTKEDRSTNMRRTGFVASEIVKHKGIVICANIAPYQEDREYNRKMISKYGGYIEVFVDTPINICEDRDVKGLYKLARQGIIQMFTGISDTFEIPEDSEIILKDYQNLGKNIQLIMDKLIELGYIKNGEED
jgi:sulfate adenylyltransferase